MNNRRKFLKNTGLGGLIVAEGSLIKKLSLQPETFHSHLQQGSVGGLNGTAADHKSVLMVKIIAGTVAVVLQIGQQLVFACLV
jgi:hypothetical protein